MNEAKKHEQLLPVYPQYIQAGYQEDEINLVDLWIALLHYKKTFLAVFSIVLVLGLLFAFTVFNERYMLNSALEIGSIGSEGSIRKLESPESIISKFSNVLIPKITASFLSENPDVAPFKTTVSSAKGSEIVLIQNKVKDSQVEIFARFQNALAHELIRDHDQKINFYQSDLKAELVKAADKLQQLKLPETLNAKLDAVYLQQKGYESKLSHIRQSFDQIKQGGDELILTTLSDEQRKILTRDGEIDQTLLNIRYQDVLLNNRIQQDELTELLEKSKYKIKEIQREHQLEVEQQQRLVDSIQVKLDTYNRTRVVTQPVPSLEPQGLTRKMLTILVVTMAVFTGFGAMLLVMFRDKVRQRLEEIS